MRSLLFLSYALFLFGILYVSYYFVDPNLTYLRWFYEHFKLQSQVEKVVVLLIILLILFLFYAIILWLYQKKMLSSRDGIVLIAMTIIILLFAYPAVYSYDIFNYIATAKIAYLFGENPYVIMPIELTGEPLLAFMHAPNKVALYGPGWIVFTSIPFFIGGGNFLITLFSFKAVVAVCYALLLYLIYKISKSFFPVLFFGLNPLIIIETLWSGHNDVVMITFLFAAFYLFFSQKRSLGLLFYLLSIVIKYATIILLPVFLILKLTRRKKTISKESLLRWSMYGMLIIFFLSTFREEIYPWYAIWFFPFVAVIGRRTEKLLAVIFTFSLELRYFPYMLSLTHFGMTPLLKIIVTFAPLIVVLVFLSVKRIWGKTSFRYLR